MINKILKENKGIVIADALVAVLIMSIFITIILGLCYNIYITARFTKRNSTATDYGIKIIEYVDKVEYNDITYDNLKNYINNILDESKFKISAETRENEKNLTTPYRVILDIEKYNETPGNEDKLDLIKTIRLEIKYNLGNLEKSLKFERVKQK